jgi:hypothetical protein
MTDQRKNYYEELIDNMMIEGIKGMNDAETASLKAYLRASDTKTKRAKILAVLVDNNTDKRKLFSEIQKTEQKYNEIKDYKMSSTKHIQNVIKMLREYVDFGDVEVKTLGEVMTPISLVEEMLDQLPDNVWTNPSLRWLDPCNGAGIFVSIIVQRLLKGLVNFEPNEDLRYKHIMENMIYVGELQPKNMFLYLYAFDPKDELDMNIYCGSYLTSEFDLHMKEIYGVEKFDIVVMNPPYQELKEGNTKSQPLWNLFVKKVVETSLIEDGYLVGVHPSGWRNISGHFKNVQMLLKSRQMLYLEIHNVNDGVKTFGASTRYDFYCLRNTKNHGNFNTKIKCQDGTIERADLSKMEFIPNGMYDTFQKLLAKKGEETVKILYDCSYHTQKTERMLNIQRENFKYPCVQNVNMKNELSCVWYSNTNTIGHFGISKVIFGRKCSGVYLDIDGNLGMAQDCTGIIDNVQNLERIKEVLLNKEFIKLLSQCDFGGTQDKYNRRVIATFRKNFWIDFLG